MSQIGDTENAVLGLLRECQLPPGTFIGTAPSAWDGNFVARLLPKTPAVMLVFLGAKPWADTASSTSLNLRAEWGAYCCVGWKGMSQEDRRRAVDGGYDMAARVAPILHNALIFDPAHQRLPIPSVTGIETLTDGSLDIGNLWVCEVMVEVELPLDIPEDCTGPLDDFIRIRGPLVVSDVADDIDLDTDLPQ